MISIQLIPFVGNHQALQQPFGNHVYYFYSSKSGRVGEKYIKALVAFLRVNLPQAREKVAVGNQGFTNEIIRVQIWIG